VVHFERRLSIRSTPKNKVAAIYSLGYECTRALPKNRKNISGPKLDNLGVKHKNLSLRDRPGNSVTLHSKVCQAQGRESMKSLDQVYRRNLDTGAYIIEIKIQKASDLLTI
jgi:hypothetical protein